MATGHDTETIADAHADQQGDDHGHDQHGHDQHGHDDHHAVAHGAGGDAWVLPPLLIGLVIGIVLIAIFGLATGAAPSV
jgi:hypothetical protein